MAESAGSDSQGPVGYQPANIRVSKTLTPGYGRPDHPATCEELWSEASFELNNLSYNAFFDRIYQDAIAGKLSKKVWMEQNTRVEFLAFLKTKRVYENLWQNVQDSDHSDVAAWGNDEPDNYTDWIAQYQDHTQYPWDSWGKYYDEKIMPDLKATK